MRRPGGFDGSDSDAEPEAPAAPREPISLPERRRRATAAPLGTSGAAAPLDAAAAPLDAAAKLDDPGDPDAPDAADALSMRFAGHPVDRRREPAEDGVRSAERALKRAQRSVREREKREQRRFTAHLRRRRRYWLAGAGAVLALVLFVAVGALSPMTAVREVRVVGATQVNADDLGAALARFEGVPLALVSERDVHRALEPFPLVQRYAIERIPPHTLVVRIEERDAVIAIDVGGSLELRDPAGVLVATATEPRAGVPLASAAAANPSSPAFAAAGRVIRDLPQDIREQLVAVTATSAQDVTFTLSGGSQVIWGEAAETQRKAVVLRSMLAAVGGVSVIDVSAPDTPVFR